MRRAGPTLARALGVLAVVLVVLAVKVIASSRAELAEGDRLRGEGHTSEAVAHYRRAARWYLPVQPFADRALDALAEIGDEAERQGDRTLALASHRSVRAALMSARSLWTPDRARLRRADERIAALMASGEVPALDAHLSEAERAALYRAMLEEDRDPALGWALLALAGLLAWLAGAYGVLTRGLDRDDRFVDAEVRRWGTAFVIGMGLFVLGLSQA